MNLNQADMITITHKFRKPNEEAAIKAIEEYKDNQAAEGYTLTKSGYVLKTKKSKGEIIDSWAVVTVEMNFEE